jgi:hypothetical protein
MDDLVDADSVLRGFGFRDLDSESQGLLQLIRWLLDPTIH